MDVVLLQEPGVPRGRADISVGDWHFIHDARTSTCRPPAIALRRATLASALGATTSKWASVIATRYDNNEVWGLISVYLPCTSSGTPTVIEATNEVEVMVLEAPVHAHTVMAGGHKVSVNKNMADSATVGPNIIERDVRYTGRAMAFRPLWQRLRMKAMNTFDGVPAATRWPGAPQ